MRCFKCMEYTEEEICEVCGFDRSAYIQPSEQLEPGTVLRDRYEIGIALGQGGFGITYIGYDRELERKVAIKECFPLGMVSRDKDSDNILPREAEKEKYQAGLFKFREEAKLLAVLPRAEEMVGIHDSFGENNTYYLVMDYIDGVSLKSYLESMDAPMEVKDALELLRPIMRALKKCHSKAIYGKKVIHRDISPNNIMITRKDHSAVLIDFGTAKAIREFTGNTTKYIRDGYSPYELYTNDPLHEGVDVYGLSATLYKMITGVEPSSSVSRRNAWRSSRSDSLKTPGELGIVMDKKVEKALLRGLALDPRKRYSSVEEFERAIYREEPLPAVKEKKKEKKWNIRKKILAAAISCAAFAAAAAGISFALQRQGGAVQPPVMKFNITTDEDGYRMADLSDMDITNLDFLEYADLSGAEGINLAENEKLSDISGLKYATDIKKLDLTDDDEISDLSVLRKMKGMETLCCQGMKQMTDLDDIAGMANLKQLYLANTGLRSIDRIGMLKKLENVSLYECYDVDSLSPLKELPALKTLNLSGLSRKVLQTVDLDVTLDYLGLFYCNSKSVSELIDSMPELGGIGISSDSVSIGRLKEKLKNLKTLSLDEYTLPVGQLTELSGLESLTIQKNGGGQEEREQLARLPFRKLYRLKELTIYMGFDNSVKSFDMAEIAQLPVLEQLDLYLPGTRPDNLQEIGSLTKLRELDLSCSFGGDFRGITELRNLVTLNLYDTYHANDSHSQYTFPALASEKLENISLSSSECNNYSALGNLVQCKKLELDGVYKDLNFLASMKKLEELTLECAYDNIADFDVLCLPNSHRLRKLSLENFVLKNAAKLSKETVLEDLNLHFPIDENVMKLKNLNFLTERSSLKKLKINECTIRDIKGFRKAKYLLSLDLSSNHIPTDVSVFRPANMPYIQNINVSDTDIRNISPFAGLKTLRCFYAENTNLNNIKGTAEDYIFNDIVYLNLSNANLEKLDWMGRCKNLKEVDISRANIRDFDIFKGASGLTLLKAERISGLENINGLSGCKKLEELAISSDSNASYWGSANDSARLPLSDAGPIKDCRDMRLLSIEGCEVDSIDAVSGMKKLESISLAGTDVRDLSALSHLKKLSSINIDGISVLDLSALSGLPVSELSIHNVKCSRLFQQLLKWKKASSSMTLSLTKGVLSKKELAAIQKEHPRWDINKY